MLITFIFPNFPITSMRLNSFKYKISFDRILLLSNDFAVQSRWSSQYQRQPHNNPLSVWNLSDLLDSFFFFFLSFLFFPRRCALCYTLSRTSYNTVADIKHLCHKNQLYRIFNSWQHISNLFFCVLWICSFHLYFEWQTLKQCERERTRTFFCECHKLLSTSNNKWLMPIFERNSTQRRSMKIMEKYTHI